MIVSARLEEKLRAALEPELLDVIDESHMHNVPKGAESHFKIVVVSARFEGLSPVKRHQLVYGVLGSELQAKSKGGGGVHALAITSRTPAEWNARPEANASPLCRGGGK